jgi:hypothetical protein
MLIVEMTRGSKEEIFIYDIDENGQIIISRTISPEEADSNQRFMECSYFFWPYLVELGVEYGWKQTGTIIQIMNLKTYQRHLIDFKVGDYEPWSDWLNLKLVIDRDAAAWADALELGLIAIKKGERKLPLRDGPILISELMSPTSVGLVNSSISIEFIQKFIDFLKKGSFNFAYDD